MDFAGSGKGGLYRNLKCAANHSKGPEICANSVSISENEVVAALAGLMRGLASDERLFSRFAQTFERLRTDHARAVVATSSTGSLDAESKKQQAKVDRVAILAGENTDTDSLLGRLRAEEATLRNLRGRRVALDLPGAPGKKALPAPSAAHLRAYFEEVEAALEA